MLSFFKGLVTIVAEIIVGIVWCIVMIAGTVLLLLVGYGLIAAFVQN